MKKILLVEDEAHVVSFITKGLSEDGYEVSVALDGKMGLTMFEHNYFDLIVLDIMLPEMNGIEVCKAIRQKNAKVPILFLTALGTSENVVIGLESGADDYLVKPFKFIELVARIKTLLRRTEHTEMDRVNSEEQEHIYRIDDLILNDYTKVVTRDDREIQLTSTEYRLLLYFLKNQNKVLSRMEILEKVWDVDFNMSTNVVDVYVNYLRKKVEPFNHSKLIHTVIGMGYVLKTD
ncbi:DNA-binding response regulator [Taibaiella sp. KBW10]|uniref:response regulator transcription factor n=1 Tax=Taibaiella sp. KBW10 TaxID=2153357 RepID=UPI000F5A6A65|nr:response regulator transcription factor [Taibaiella sp. KBW10]RQO32512.1 DNA-binding response regulator [Taibaiella sp. KBW10]